MKTLIFLLFCTFSISIVSAQYEVVLDFEQPPVLTVTFEVRDTITENENRKIIDLTVQGGIPPYSFSWSGDQTTEDLVVSNSTNEFSVRVTDYSGCSEFLQLIITAADLPELVNNLAITIFPNPNRGDFQFTVAGAPSDKLEIIITTLNGRRLILKTINHFTGHYSGDFNLANIGGIYHFTAKTSTEVVSKHFIIQ